MHIGMTYDWMQGQGQDQGSLEFGNLGQAQSVFLSSLIMAISPDLRSASQATENGKSRPSVPHGI